LFFTQNNGNYVCSASVTGLYGIVTAGHCIHAGNNKSTGWSTNIVFVPAYIDGQAPYGQWTCKTTRTFTAWYKSGDLARDWGVCKTNTNDGVNIGNMVGTLGYTWNYGRNQDWWLLGYPAAAPFNGARMQACTAGYAYDSPFGTSPDPMGVGCDQTGGTSGGPWIKGFGTGNWVGGVNSHRTTTKPKELFSPYADTAVKTSYFDYTRAP
jgi:V8-like Glu-specific endopeptidase